jgi:alpha-L-fucosidase
MKTKNLIFLIVLLSFQKVMATDLQELQRNFAEWRFGLFMHFGIGTYTDDDEWGQKPPAFDPKMFNPQKLDCDQWADAAKSAGMTFAFLTTRHHYGFALWPTKFGNFNVMNSSYPHDVVGMYVDAFRKKGIKPCFYYSIYDRTFKVEKGHISREDIDYVKGQITELLTNYGEIPALMIDGWAWQMGHKDVPYQEIRSLIKKLQPNCLLIDLNGLTENWESDVLFYEEPKGIYCPESNTDVSCQGMTISREWFWHPYVATSEPMNTEKIVKGHLNILEKRHCNFILNCPPNRDGLLDDNIVKQLKEVGQTWKPDYSRPRLPQQPEVLKYPISPVNVTASSGNAFNAIDGFSDIFNIHNVGQSLWETSGKGPNYIILDLGQIYKGIDMLTYLPRQDMDSTGTKNTLGTITTYKILTSTDGKSYSIASEGTWEKDKHLKREIFKPVIARYIKLEAEENGDGTITASEIDCGSYQKEPISIVK